MKTKLNLKILLLVSILLIAMCLFNTNMVQATTVTTQAEYDTLKAKVESLMPDTVSLTIKESEALNGSSDEFDGNRGKAVDLVQTKFNELLKANNISLPIIFTNGNTTQEVNYYIGFSGDYTYEAQAGWKDYIDIHKMSIYVSSTSQTGGSSGSSGGETEKKINVKYSDTNIENSKKIMELIPNTIEITKTKTDFVNAIIENEKNDNSNIFSKKVEEINAEVKTKILDLLEKSDEIDIQESEKSLIDVQMLDPFADFYTIRVSLKSTNYEKEITIKYAKESNFNETDETYVKNAIKNIKFAKYKCDEDITTDAVFTMYNIGDEESASKWDYKSYNFDTLINDSSITIKTSMFAGGIGGATPWGVPMLLHFYKNGVLYETKPIWNLGAYGVTLENGTPVNMAKLDKEYDKEIYTEMEKQLKDKGIANIIGAYELTAYGNTYNNMSISFNIGTKYNGKQVIVLHKKSNNTYETLTATVKDGKATVTVSELSPFMIALKGDRKLDNEPKTRCCRLYNICKCSCSYFTRWNSNIKI